MEASNESQRDDALWKLSSVPRSVAAISGLAAAFLALAFCMVIVANLNNAVTAMRAEHRITAYLKGYDHKPAELKSLEQDLRRVRGVAEVIYRSPEHARKMFARSGNLAQLEEMPSDYFPAAIDIYLASADHVASIKQVERQASHHALVENVESYTTWYRELNNLLFLGRLGIGVLCVVILLCVLTAVGSAVKLSLTQRAVEIEVARLCGATARFIQKPFVLQGALQGLFAMVIAVSVLAVAFLALRSHLTALTKVLLGFGPVFLGPFSLLALLLGSTALGAASSAWSVRRYLHRAYLGKHCVEK